MTSLLLGLGFAGCLPEAHLEESPALAPPDTLEALSKFAPDPEVREEINNAYAVSQSLNCILLDYAETQLGPTELKGLCQAPGVALAELVATTCTALPPNIAETPTLGVTELVAMDQLDRFGQAYPIESVSNMARLISSDQWLLAAQTLATFEQVKSAVSAWDPDGAIICANQGKAASDQLGLQLLSGQYTEAMAFAKVRSTEYELSKSLFEDARAQYASLEDPYFSRRLDGNHAALHDRREFNQAQAVYGARRALEAFIATGDTRRTGRALIKQAIAAYYDYDLDYAETLSRAAIALGSATSEPAIEGEAQIALGHTLSERGDVAAASSAYRAAMSRFNAQSPGRLHWLNAFSSLINIEIRALQVTAKGAERSSDLSALDQKVTRAEAFLADLSPEQWVELKINHAKIKLELDQLAEAEHLANLASEKVVADALSLWEVPTTLLKADIAAKRMEDPTKALALYAEAERASRAIGDLTLAWTSLLGQAAVHQHLQQRQAALTNLEQAALLVEQLWRDVAASNRKGTARGAGSATFLESQLYLYDRAVEILLKGDPTKLDQVLAWWWSERRRSNELRARLGAVDSASTPQRRAQDRLANVQKSLSTGKSGLSEVIFEYHVSASSAWVFLITPDTFETYALPLDAPQIELHVSTAFPFLSGAPEGSPVNQNALALLSDALLGRAMPLVEPGSLIRVIPDGRLTLVPFDALTWKNAPLIRTHPLVYGSTPSDENTGPSRLESQTERLMSIAVADELYGLPALPCADNESRAMTTGPNDRALRGGLATEDAFRQYAPSFDILHIAAHGIVEEGSWRRSHLALHPGPVHDGKLTLEEIAQLDLTAQLAVVPSCRSGVARIFRGEGIQGVGSAFRSAGVPSTIVGLWALPDVSGTTELVVRTIAYARQGHSLPQALRYAKLDVMDAEANIFVWAPLVLYGSATQMVGPTEIVGRIAQPQVDMNGPCKTRPVRDLYSDLVLRLEDAMEPSPHR